MTHISHQITINAPKERVWEILADLGEVKRYHPGLTDSYYNSGEKRGVGASRHCDLKPFGSIDERVIEWNDGESYTLEIYDGKKVPPFKKSNRDAFGSAERVWHRCLDDVGVRAEVWSHREADGPANGAFAVRKGCTGNTAWLAAVCRSTPGSGVAIDPARGP